MRGDDLDQGPLFSYLSPEQRVPLDHPLRRIRALTDEALGEMSSRFAAMYSRLGRPSIAPEKLLRALLLQVFYSVRSERMLMEQLNYNLLFRWFVGLNMDDAIWDVTVFSKNRQRLLDGDVAHVFFSIVVEHARGLGLLSSEHFTVDGTLLEAWAGTRSYQKKADRPEKGSGTRGRVLLRDTHECQTDPEAHLYRKSNTGPYQLSYLGHVLTENRNGLPVNAQVTTATPSGEWDAAVEMIAEVKGKGRVTLAADKAYDQAELLQRLRVLLVTPHFQKYEQANRSSHLDGRTTRHPGYAASCRQRKRIEHIFGWVKTTALMSKVRHRGRNLVDWMFTLALSAYNLIRIQRLTAEAR